MARRSDHTREELKEMAIMAGKNLIITHGYSTFSARKVAQEIEYSVGTIFNIFESYESLVLHINATTLEDMYGFITRNPGKPGGKPIDNLKMLALSYLEFAEGNYKRWSALFEFNLPPGEFLPEWYMQKVTKLFDVVEEAVQPLCNNSAEQAALSSKILWASVNGICHLALTTKLEKLGSEPAIPMLESLIENYVAGLQVRK